MSGNPLVTCLCRVLATDSSTRLHIVATCMPCLKKAGVSVELHVIQGGIHGYDLVEGSPTAAAALAIRLEAIRRLLA